jgi:hypothetical protein
VTIVKKLFDPTFQVKREEEETKKVLYILTTLYTTTQTNRFNAKVSVDHVFKSQPDKRRVIPDGPKEHKTVDSLLVCQLGSPIT